MSARMLIGDCLEQLAALPDESVHCCITSPPYYGLRDYGTATWDGGDPECEHDGAISMTAPPGSAKQASNAGANAVSRGDCRHCGATRQDSQIGLEPTPEEHIAKLVEVFREVRRVLRKDGVLWLNYGDAYAGSWGAQDRRETPGGISRNQIANHPKRASHTGTIRSDGIKPKDLLMMPARVALALQADGWWLRSMMPWVKRSAMPESVTDRPATAIEYVFLLAKSGEALFWQHRDGGAVNVQPEPDYRWTHKDTKEERDTAPPGWVPGKKSKWQRANLWRGRDYFFDMEAVRQADCGHNGRRPMNPETTGTILGRKTEPHGGLSKMWEHGSGRNFRNSDLFYASLEPPHGLICGDEPLALDVNPAGFSESHFATFPPKLVEPLIKAGTSEKGVCAECGAPWVREVASEFVKLADRKPGRKAHQGAMADINSHEKMGYNSTKTTGWSLSCACDTPGTVPATILDPFGGAGTVGLVADRLGRNSILIELNPEYADMARRRISGDAPLFAEVSA